MKYKSFEEKLKDFMTLYPEFSIEEIEKRASREGGYSFFSQEYPMKGLNPNSFLKELEVKEIREVACPVCGEVFTKNDYKNISTPFKKHRDKCQSKRTFIEKFNWTKNSLDMELYACGTIQDMIDKYKDDLPGNGRILYEILKDFGIDTSMKRMADEVLSRSRKTSLERHGVAHNFSKDHPSRILWEQRLKDEENIDNVFQREEVKQKIKHTMLKNHGVEVPYQSEEIKERGKQTCLKHYGYDHHMKNPEFLEKYIEDRVEKHGGYTIDFFMYEKNEFHGIHFSKPHKKVVNLLLENHIPAEVEYIIKIPPQLREEGMNKKFYSYDILISGTKKLIEVNGDYYHANPDVYNEDDIINFWGKELLVKDVWKKDSLKTKLCKKSGYDILTVWEKDITKNWYTISKEILEYARG